MATEAPNFAEKLFEVKLGTNATDPSRRPYSTTRVELGANERPSYALEAKVVPTAHTRLRHVVVVRFEEGLCSCRRWNGKFELHVVAKSTPERSVRSSCRE
jgi:hypothetical protein